PWALGGAADPIIRAVATGRTFWESLDHPALRPGTPRRAVLFWAVRPNGDQQLCCLVANLLSAQSTDSDSLPAEDVEVILDVHPALYIDPKTCESGVLEIPCPLSLLQRHWYEPPIHPEQVDAIREQMTPEARLYDFPRPAVLS